jgi:hypothetical protein
MEVGQEAGRKILKGILKTCENGRWMELAQDRVQWQVFVLAVLNLRVLLPELVN